MRPLSKSKGVILLVALLSCVAIVARAEIAVVVHADNPLETLSLSELKRIYLGKQTNFGDGTTITLGASEGMEESFYDAVLGMTAFKFRRHWVKEIFAGGVGKPPESLHDPEAVLQFIAADRGAIAFIEANETGIDTRVVAIEGQRPGEDGYPLASPDASDPTETK